MTAMTPNEKVGPQDTTPGETDTDSHRYATKAQRTSDGQQNRDAAMHDHAIALAGLHWEVFPLSGKVPLFGNPHCKYTPERKNCKGECGQRGHGVLDATDNVEVVSQWWTSFPEANIGGRIPRSMLMVDVDPRHGGDVSWEALERRYGRFPDCLMVVSGRGDGGTHRYMRRPYGKLSSRRLGPGIDLKTSNGYAVLAPSIHPDTGKPYVWVDGPIIAPPLWFISLVVERPTAPKRNGARRASYSASPAEWYNASKSWEDVLGPKGWDCYDADPDEDGACWLHPEATSSCSATVRHDCLFVYSTNTPFEVTECGNPHGYTKFRAYAVLNHKGDMSAAAKAILKGRAK